MATVASAVITAADTYTDPCRLEGYFNVSIGGTFSATVTVQRSVDAVTWVDVDTWTAPAEDYGFEPENMYYRIGVKSGAFTSGSVTVRIGREDKDVH